MVDYKEPKTVKSISKAKGIVKSFGFTITDETNRHIIELANELTERMEYDELKSWNLI